MKTTLLRLGAIAAILSFVGTCSPIAFAATPTLSAVPAGNGDSVQLNVSGDPNAAVWLYKNTYSGQQPQYLGTTGTNGYLSVAVSTSSSGLAAGNYVYVLVNGQPSQQVAWPAPYGSGYYGGSIFLSQSNVNLTMGQNATVTISGGSQPYTQYPGSNASNIFQSVISGNTLTLTPINAGSGSLNICSSGGVSSGCATLYVTVNGYNGGYNSNPGNSQLSFSQNNISLNTGAITTVTVYGLSGSYFYVSSNSNPSVVSANISGNNTLYLSALTYGTSTITVCQNAYQCGTLYVTVGNGYQQNPVAIVPPISFSQNSLTLGANQTGTVTVSGGSGSGYYIASTMPGGSVQASLNGNILSVASLNSPAGSAGIIVCSSAGTCGGMTVTFSGTGYGAYSNNSNWIYCASEGQPCNFYGTQTVRYGANGHYVYKTLPGGTACGNGTFGDPIFGTAKQCYYGGTIGY